MGFFNAIATFLGSIVQIFFNFFTGIAQLLWTIPKAVTMLTYSVAQLPPVLLIYATAFISVSVVYLVIDR